MPDWRCHRCGVINLEGQRACESCGREPHATPVEPPHPAAQTWESCAWTTQGHPCQLIATLGVQPVGNYAFNKFGQITNVLRPAYCSWHFECLSSPRLTEDFDEFERMHRVWLEKPYCNQLVHHPAAYVWEALRGRERPMSERLVVTPCRAHDCWVSDVIGPHAAGSPVAPKEARARIRASVAMLAAKMTLTDLK